MRATVAVVILLGLPFAAAAAPRQPNVLLIISDDQGYGDLGCHGNKHLETPHLDRLAHQSVRFDQFLVNPLCAPTRAALLTGRYSIRSGVSGVARGEETMRAEEVTLGELFHANGYKTGYFGKWHNGEHYPYTPPGQGFAESLSFNLGHWNNYFDTSLKRNGAWTSTKGYITNVLTDAAIAFIDKHKNTPWFCYVAYNVPHSPHQCPSADFDKYKKMGLSDELACVYGMCDNMDQNIGRILMRLDNHGLTNDTIVIFLTDNGPNGDRYNAGMRGKKGSYYHGGIRVPCFVRWPDHFVPRAVSRVAAHIDIFPTLAELTRAAMPQGLSLDGRSLVPLLRGKPVGWPDRIIFIQNRPAGAGGNNSGCVRADRFSLVNTAKGSELYDVEVDPGQTKNIATQKPEMVQSLRKAYDDWLTDVSRGARAQRLPIPVGYESEPIVELPAPQADLEGGVKFAGRHPNNAWVTGWERKDARIVWHIDVVEGGEYEVLLQFINEKPKATQTVQLTIGSAKVTSTIPATKRIQVNSPDRVPRTEVYEMVWESRRIGSVRLSTGRQTVAVGLDASDSLELKNVTLKRVK